MPSMDERKWLRLVKAFRETPGNIRNAAKEASVDRMTARRAWTAGYPTLNRKPIQEIMRLEEEERNAAAAARAATVRNETEAFAAALRGDVRQGALEEYERTTQYLRAAAMTATSTLVATHKLQPVVQELGAMAPRLVERVYDEIVKGELSATQAMTLLEKIAAFSKAVAMTANSATQTGAKVVELSRARTGDVLNVVNSRDAVASEPFDAVEAKRLAEELAAAAMDMEMANGPILAVLPGGNGTPAH